MQRLPFELAGLGIVTAGEGERSAPRRPAPSQPPAQPKPPSNAAQAARDRIAARMDREDVAVNPRTFNNTPSATAAAKLPLNLKVTPAPTHAATAVVSGQIASKMPGKFTTAVPSSPAQPAPAPAPSQETTTQPTPQQVQQLNTNGGTTSQLIGPGPGTSFTPYTGGQPARWDIPAGPTPAPRQTAASQENSTATVPAAPARSGSRSLAFAAGGLGVGTLLFLLFRGKRR